MPVGTDAEDKHRRYWEGEKPTDEERRKAEREALEVGRRGTINQGRHADDCACPVCKPGDWK